MTKTNLKDLAGEAIVLLHEMFGEGIEFDCIEYFKSNEALTGIALKLPGCTTIPTVCLDDMPDNATAKDIANIAATTFQAALRDFKKLPAAPELTRETVLENVVLQALSRKRNRQMLKTHPHITFLDLAATEAAPWYVTADLNHYIDGHKKAYYEAVEAARVVQEFIDYTGPEKRTDLAARLAVGLGISPQSFYRYQTQVLEANAWALKLEREDGLSRDYFRALALCRKPKEADTFPSLTPEQRALIENIWFDKQFASNLGTREMLYEKFEEIARERGWTDYPSAKTVGRYINYLMSTRGAASAHFLAANGTREWRNKMMLKGKRDATTLEVMELLVGDEHTFDLWVQYTAPNGKVKAVRPVLVAWMDMRSRDILGKLYRKMAE